MPSFYHGVSFPSAVPEERCAPNTQTGSGFTLLSQESISFPRARAAISHPQNLILNFFFFFSKSGWCGIAWLSAVSVLHFKGVGTQLKSLCIHFLLGIQAVEVGVNRVAVISLIRVAGWGYLDGAQQLWLLLGWREDAQRLLGVGAGGREQNLNWEIPVDYYSCLH